MSSTPAGAIGDAMPFNVAAFPVAGTFRGPIGATVTSTVLAYVHRRKRSSMAAARLAPQ
jgi:hypothetical protein